jgi:hypothetical protein
VPRSAQIVKPAGSRCRDKKVVIHWRCQRLGSAIIAGAPSWAVGAAAVASAWDSGPNSAGVQRCSAVVMCSSSSAVVRQETALPSAGRPSTLGTGLVA